MKQQILLNLAIAFLWMFFFNTWNASMFFLGYCVGLGLLYALRNFLPRELYVWKVYAIVKLLLIFLKELVLSGYFVMKEILRPKMDIRPGIIAVPTHLKSDWEITLLACLVTLTPGTLGARRFAGAGRDLRAFHGYPGHRRSDPPNQEHL